MHTFKQKKNHTKTTHPILIINCSVFAEGITIALDGNIKSVGFLLFSIGDSQKSINQTETIQVKYLAVNLIGNNNFLQWLISAQYCKEECTNFLGLRVKKIYVQLYLTLKLC